MDGRIPRQRAPAARRMVNCPALPRRLRDLVAAALMAGGDRSAILRRLKISPPILRQRLSMLKARGVARTVTIYDPKQAGRPIETVTLVALSALSADSLAQFEALLLSDSCVTMAARVSGRFDYQLTSFHTDIRDVDAWRRGLASRPCVAKVSQRRVETLVGNQLAGFPLSPP
jgi:DNA-binding Lrp family transcriptional regulator